MTSTPVGGYELIILPLKVGCGSVAVDPMLQCKKPPEGGFEGLLKARCRLIVNS